MRLRQFYEVLRDTDITDEFMFFTIAISSPISRASPSNVHFTPGLGFRRSHPDAFKNLAILTCSSSRIKDKSHAFRFRIYFFQISD